MKLFDKEYFDKLFNIFDYNTLVIDSKAEYYEETLYQILYNEKHKEYLRLYGDVENIKDNFNDYVTFLINERRRQLPDDLISNIKDIRIAALGIVSEHVFFEIKKYVDSIETFCYRRNKEYYEHLNSIKNLLSKNCINALNCSLDDARFLKYIKVDKDLKVYFSLDSYTNENGYDLVYTFINGDIVENIGGGKQDYLKQTEIYYNNCKIEFHILCEESQYIIVADDLYRIYSEQYIVREGI